MSTTRPTTTRAVHLPRARTAHRPRTTFALRRSASPSYPTVKSWLPMTSCRSIRTCVVG